MVRSRRCHEEAWVVVLGSVVPLADAHKKNHICVATCSGSVFSQTHVIPECLVPLQGLLCSPANPFPNPCLFALGLHQLAFITTRTHS